MIWTERNPKKKKKRKDGQTSFDEEIELELDKLFGPKRKRCRSRRLSSSGISKNMFDSNISIALKGWKDNKITFRTKENSTNRLAKMNVYFKTNRK